MTTHFSRRDFLKSSAVAASLAAVNVAVPAYCQDKAPSSKLNLAIIGVANRASANYHAVLGENIVALCDIDARFLDTAAKSAPKAQTFADYRKLLESVKDLDAVVVSTPDHTHAPASVMAMKMGLHCYCEKPLAHSIYETRLMQTVAEEKNLCTQMGTQIHAEDTYRRVVEIVQSGAIGKVRNVYIWFRNAWGYEPDAQLPTDTPPVPDYVNWDCWLGPAQYRPYNPCYLPRAWRKWWAFGSGTMGDMGTHLLDLAFWALKLKNCKTIKAVDGPKVNPETTPLSLEIEYGFESDGEQPDCTVHWLDGGKCPDILKEKNIPERYKAVLFDGEKGQLVADYDYFALYPEEEFKSYQAPKPWIPKSIGHHNEWLQAIRDNKPENCLCRFSYGGRLTETVLLGTLAYRTGEDLVWDAAALKTNSAAANAMIEVPYREGWSF